GRSRRSIFRPIPLMRSRSSTARNFVRRWRRAKIARAREGPMPGSFVSSASVAALRTTRPSARRPAPGGEEASGATGGAVGGVVARFVIADLQRAAGRQRIELYVDRAVLVGERDANAIPVGLVVALGDDVRDFEFRLFHCFLSVGTTAEAQTRAARRLAIS